MEHPTHNPPDPKSAGHEVLDAPVRPIAIFVVAFVFSLLGVQLLGWIAWKGVSRYVHAANHLGVFVHPLSNAMNAPPPAPQLEPSPTHDELPRGDLLTVRADEQALLGENSWKWIDADHRFARIPLQQAISAAVENGLPEILPATQPTTQPFMPPASSLHGPGGVP